MAEPPYDAIQQRMIAWIEANIPCKLLSLERHQRWRIGWYADVRMADGTTRALYLRGERSTYEPDARTEHGIKAFRSEYRIMQIFEEEGLTVPHVYGMCPDPLVIVTDRAPGRADLSTAESDAERAVVLAQYMAELARIHAIDPARFDGLTLPRPSSPDRISLTNIERMEHGYRLAKNRPEPVIEYLLQWLKRNAPRGHTRLSLVLGDPAQFMFDKGRMTALIDFETAYLGDPVQDVAGLQHRNTTEPLGDIPAALRAYQAAKGEPIDAAAHDFQAVVFGLVTPLGLTDSVTRPHPTHSVLQYLEWWINFCRTPIELIAAMTGRALTPEPPIEAEPLPFGAMAESLPGAIEAIPAAEGFASFERDATARLARFVGRLAEYGPAMMRKDLAETEALLGRRFDGAAAADAALETHVIAAGPEMDDVLIPFLYKRVHRQWQLFRPFRSTATADDSFKTFAQLMAS